MNRAIRVSSSTNSCKALSLCTTIHNTYRTIIIFYNFIFFYHMKERKQATIIYNDPVCDITWWLSNCFVIRRVLLNENQNRKINIIYKNLSFIVTWRKTRWCIRHLSYIRNALWKRFNIFSHHNQQNSFKTISWFNIFWWITIFVCHRN